MLPRTHCARPFACTLSVARHKAMFFSENDATGARIDHEAAVSGDPQLVPAGAARAALADDYARMPAVLPANTSTVTG